MPISPLDRKLQRARVRRFSLIIWLLFIVLFGRLWHLQIAQGEDLLRQSETNRLRLLRVRAPRGLILDRNNRTVATSRPHFVVSVIPEEIMKSQEPEQIKASQEAVERLCKILQISQDELRAIITRNQSVRGAPVRVALDANMQTVAMIEEQKLLLPGVSVELDQIRFYPDGSAFSHALGYLREIDQQELSARRDLYRPGDFIGKSGLERQYDTLLHGTDGGELVEVDANGIRTRLMGDQESIPGDTLVLSLDKEVQAAASEALEGKIGAAVAVDPRTGEVLAMVSKPDFDPNIFVSALKASDWRQIKPNLQNRAISSQNPPGSTFKIVTAAAGLKNNVITTKSTANCPGAFYLGRARFGCWTRHNHVNFYTAISKSCDVFFYQAGHRMGIDKLAEMARNFGMGEKTGIDLPKEVAGFIPTTRWKRETFREDWYPGETVVCSIGQGDVAATPLQMAIVAAAIANNGKIMKPHMVKEIRNKDGKVLRKFEPQVLRTLPITQEDIQEIKKGMVETVSGAGGTGRIVQFEGLTAGAKTGSAQHKRGRKTHAWFICFAPVEDPQIAICVFRHEGGHGGSDAGPVARAMIEAWFKLKHKDVGSVGRTD